MGKYYKGFNENLECRGYQYEVGKTYTEDEAVICQKGFHACENPLDTFNYYAPNDSRYCEVELDSDIKKKNSSSDTNVCAKEIKIGSEIGIEGIIKAAVNYMLGKMDQDEGKKATTGDDAHAATTGYRAHAVTTGYRAHAAATGYRAHAATTGNDAHAATTGNRAHAATTGDDAHAAATGNRAHAATTGDDAHAATTGYRAHAVTTGNRAHAATTGNYAHAATTGDDAHAAATGDYASVSVSSTNSVAFTAGIDTKVKGGLGSWLVAAEWIKADSGWQIKDIHKAKVDGDSIKPDTWYKAKDGGLVEVSCDV